MPTSIIPATRRPARPRRPHPTAPPRPSADAAGARLEDIVLLNARPEIMTGPDNMAAARVGGVTINFAFAPDNLQARPPPTRNTATAADSLCACSSSEPAAAAACSTSAAFCCVTSSICATAMLT